MTIREKLKKDFETAANNYLGFFCVKHGFDYEDARNSWAADRVGTTVSVADHFIDMEAIRTDIDKDAPEGEFVKWHDYDLTMRMLGEVSMNYEHWLMGAPRKSRAEIQEMEAAYQREHGTFSPKCIGCE